MSSVRKEDTDMIQIFTNLETRRINKGHPSNNGDTMRLVRSILTEALFHASRACVNHCIDPDCCRSYS